MAQLKDLIVYGDTKFLGDVTLDHDPTASLHAATKAYVDAQVGTGTDEKVQVSALTSGTKYYPILATGTGTATRQADTTGGGFTYTATLGTSGASTAGTAILQVGNSLYVGQANNLMGVIRVYEAGSSGAGVARYTDIRAGTGTANNTIYLPYGTSTYPSSYLVAASQRGTAIGSTTQPVYVNSEGFIEACNSYTDTKVSLTSTTTSASYPLALGPSSITSGSAYGEYYNASFYANPNTLTMYTPKLVINNGNSQYNGPLTVKTTTASTGDVAAAFYNNTTTTSSTTWISGMNILAPNMVANTSMSYANFAVYNCGVALSTCNAGNLAFHYSGSGSTANCLSFGLYGHNNILNIVGTDRIGIMNTAPSYTLDVTGTIHASVGVKIGTSSEIKSIGSGLSVDANGALYATNATTGTVTGSGINGYLAKWTGADGQSVTELTVGPAIGTSTTTYLREDGTWATPATVSHAHGDIDYSGAITTNPGTTIASGDALLIADSSLGNTIKKSATTFGTSTTTYLRNDGTWGTPAGTDTKVTQTNISSGTDLTTFRPLVMVKNSGQSTNVTDTVTYTSYASMNPAGELTVQRATTQTSFNYSSNAYTQYNSTLKAIEFIFN